MYFKGVNPFKAFIKDPVFSYYYFINSGIRVAYAKFTKKKLKCKVYAGKKVIINQMANELLKETIYGGTPFMFGRFGSNEISIITNSLLRRKKISDISPHNLKISCEHCGFFPVDAVAFDKFATLMLNSISQVDIQGVFRMIQEDYYIKTYMSQDVKLTNLNVMDFWQYEKPFTEALKGKNVLVIHPLANLIMEQYKNRKRLFTNPHILPDFNLSTVKAVQTIANQQDTRFSDWFEALEYMFNEALKQDFEIALIGCGAYGYPLAAKIKQAGKIAIHMGGVTQILFGIKGSRWDIHPQVSKLYNECWVRPAGSDIPQNANSVENGCYW